MARYIDIRLFRDDDGSYMALVQPDGALSATVTGDTEVEVLVESVAKVEPLDWLDSQAQIGLIKPILTKL